MRRKGKTSTPTPSPSREAQGRGVISTQRREAQEGEVSGARLDYCGVRARLLRREAQGRDCCGARREDVEPRRGATGFFESCWRTRHDVFENCWRTRHDVFPNCWRPRHDDLREANGRGAHAPARSSCKVTVRNAFLRHSPWVGRVLVGNYLRVPHTALHSIKSTVGPDFRADASQNLIYYSITCTALP